MIALLLKNIFVTAALLSAVTFALPRFILPAETDQHAGTIITWPTRSSVYTPDWPYAGANFTATQIELADLARTIAKYEPVQLFVRDPSTYTDDQNDGSGFEAAHRLLGDVENVTIHATPNADSLWARDNNALFAYSVDGVDIQNLYGPHDDPGIGMIKQNTSSSVVGLLLNFNQWGKKLPPNPESYIAATCAQKIGVSAVVAPLVGEGGAIEVDGEGTMIATESSLLDPNRNPGIDKAQIQEYFYDFFGVHKHIWIPGFRGYDITDDHIDGLARFGGLTDAGERVVLLDRYFVPPNASKEAETEILADYMALQEVLGNSTDAKGRKFKTVTGIVTIEPNPAKVLGNDYHPKSGPSVAYVNFHVVNGAVIMSKFGDKEVDDEAARVIGEQFPRRKIEQVYTHQIAIQGGGIHCSTQQYYL